MPCRDVRVPQVAKLVTVTWTGAVATRIPVTKGGGLPSSDLECKPSTVRLATYLELPVAIVGQPGNTPVEVSALPLVAGQATRSTGLR